MLRYDFLLLDVISVVQVPNSLICVDYMVQLWLPLRIKATVKFPAILLTIIRSEIVLEHVIGDPGCRAV